MTKPDEPLVWHYGLMAERWAAFNTEAPEASFFLQVIARSGQPVLDLACGTGRVLLPILRSGVDIDGCDISADMLEHCRVRAAREGFRPNLYAQPMHAVALPRTYRTIYICDSFGLGGSLENDLETLRRCYAHLAEGGTLVLNIEAEYTDPTLWALWSASQHQNLPQPWPEAGGGRAAPDGSEHIGRFRILALDPLDQTVTRQVRLEKWQAGVLVAAEEYTLRGRMYFRDELLLMLRLAGFHDITVCGDYTDTPATAEHRQLVFSAIR
jgi:SAM-dependent methyltransferase